MTQLKQSFASPPEFFVDRSLGVRFCAQTADRGWRITRISDVYPNDAQEIDDPRWIRYGVEQGWALLSKDKRIRYHTNERDSLGVFGILFVLSRSSLRIDGQVAWFDANRNKIDRLVKAGHTGLYAVYQHDVVRRWP